MFTLEAPPAVGAAIAEIAAGRPVVVIDQSRNNEGDLVFAAQHARPGLMAFAVRHGSGFVTVALPPHECERLGLPAIRGGGDQPYHVTLDAAEGGTTGISARDRARTARLLADAAAGPADFHRPGHVVPLAARSGGVLERPGRGEAALDLTRLAGLRPAGVLSGLVSTRSPGRMADRDELARFAAAHRLVMISVAELAEYRRATEPQVVRATTARLTARPGQVHMVGYRAAGGSEHLALVRGTVRGARDVPVHVHLECPAADPPRCDCGARLDTALREIARRECGVVVYLRAAGPTMTDSRLAHPGAAVDDAVTAHILRDLGVQSPQRLDGPSSCELPADEVA